MITSTNGITCVVDDDAPAEIFNYKWYAYLSGERRYFRCQIGSKRKNIFLHRMIIDAKEGQSVDHINGDTLDNRRSNLRSATIQQNNFNRRRGPKAKTGFRGVEREWNKYRAYVQFNKKTYRLHGFDNPVDAAKARDRLAKELHGEFAVLNFPESMETK